MQGGSGVRKNIAGLRHVPEGSPCHFQQVFKETFGRKQDVGVGGLTLRGPWELSVRTTCVCTRVEFLGHWGRRWMRMSIL